MKKQTRDSLLGLVDDYLANRRDFESFHQAFRARFEEALEAEEEFEDADSFFDEVYERGDLVGSTEAEFRMTMIPESEFRAQLQESRERYANGETEFAR